MTTRCVLLGDSGTSGGRKTIAANDRGEQDALRWGERLELPGGALMTQMFARPSQRASDVVRRQLPEIKNPRSVGLVFGTLGGVDLGWQRLLLRCSRALPTRAPSDEELECWASRIFDPAVAAWMAIRDALPNATVVSVGYPVGVFWPRDRRLFSEEAVAQVRTAQRLVDAQMAAVARAAGVHYVGLLGKTDVEHTYGWVWGLIPGVTEGPSFHLTPSGHRRVAKIVTEEATPLVGRERRRP